MRSKKPFILLLALLATFSLIAAACGDDDDGASASGNKSTTTAQTDDTKDSSSTMDDSGDTSDVAAPVGDACSAIPASGEGSSAGMADDTAGTAASNNPVLTTLVSAVKAADLVDALNDPDVKYTIFAPANAVFDKIPADTLGGLLKPDQKDALTDILTYQVYSGGMLDLDGIVAKGQLEMLNGDTITVSKDGDTAKINGESVVICGNVTTSNATVHIIDSVLMPPA